MRPTVPGPPAATRPGSSGAGTGPGRRGGVASASMAGMNVVDRRWVARLGTAAGLLVTLVALLLAPAVPASAHAVLASSSPVASAVVPSARPRWC